MTSPHTPPTPNLPTAHKSRRVVVADGLGVAEGLQGGVGLDDLILQGPLGRGRWESKWWTDGRTEPKDAPLEPSPSPASPSPSCGAAMAAGEVVVAGSAEQFQQLLQQKER